MSAASKIDLLLASLWTQNESLMRDRVAILHRAAIAYESGQITQELREEAVSISHNLAGSLGMFGFPRGTDIARELERDFSAPFRSGLSAKITELAGVMFPESEQAG